MWVKMESANRSNSLSFSFGQTLATPLRNEGKQILEDILEAGIDTAIEDGFLRNIPFLSVAVSLAKIHNEIDRWFMIKKLASFINQIDNSVTEDERAVFLERYNSQNEKDRKRELEYLLVIINRYITVEQPCYLAKIYLSFLRGYIRFNELVLFSRIIDSLLPEDIFVLVFDTLPSDQGHFITYLDYIRRLRLCGLIEADSSEKTSLGKALHDILQQ